MMNSRRVELHFACTFTFCQISPTLYSLTKVRKKLHPAENWSAFKKVYVLALAASSSDFVL